MLYAREIPHLSNEESLLAAARVALGAGTLSEAGRSDLMLAWSAGRRCESPREEDPEKALARLRLMGFAIEERDPANG